MTSRYKYLKPGVRYFLNISQPVAKMEQLRKQVFETFGYGIGEGENFQKHLEKLVKMMSKLTAENVCLDLKLLQPKAPEEAPVTYVEILEHPRFTINMFILRPGSRLPLHNHPNMYGISKVVQGKVRIRSFTPVSLLGKLSRDKLLSARIEPERIVTERDGAVLLTPEKGNIHELQAMDGGAAFVDVLAPPYKSNIDGHGPRPCHYFIERSDSVKDGYVEFMPVHRVSEYYTDFAPYLGP